MDSDEWAHLIQLLEINRSSLRDVELQQSKWGTLVPPHIILQIKEYKSKIAELESLLASQLPFSNLGPRDYDNFIGRKKEFEEIISLLLPYPKSRHHLIAIDGIGGIGKTSLASEVANYFRDNYSSLPKNERFEAIIWVSAKHTYLMANAILETHQSFRTLQDLFAAIAHVLYYPAITRARAEEQRDIVISALSRYRTLLILDNLETIENDDLLIFLIGLPDPSKAIVTTRHRIDVAFPLRLGGLPNEEATELISQECNRKKVSLSNEDRDELLRRTGGVPLAVVWSIGLIGLGSSPQSVFHRLSRGQNDIAKFCFGESMSRIREKNAYKILLSFSLFYVDADAEAIGYISGFEDDKFARDEGLSELLQLSLVNRDGERYSLLPLTRDFVKSEAHREAAWLEAAEERCQNYFSKLAKNLGGYSKDWRGHDRVEREMSNILMVIESMANKIKFDKTADGNQQISQSSILTAKMLIDFMRVVIRTCRIRGYWADCESLCQKSIQLGRYLNDSDSIGWRYYDLSRISYSRGDFELAKHWASECKNEWQKAGLPTSQALRLLGIVALDQDQITEAEKLITESFLEYQRLGVDGTLSHFLESLGKLAEKRGEYQNAIEWYTKAIDINRQKNDLVNLTTNLINLGNLLMGRENYDAAREFFEESLKLARQCGRVDNIAESEFRLGLLEFRTNHQKEARDYLQHAVDLYQRLAITSKQDQASEILAQVKE